MLQQILEREDAELLFQKLGPLRPHPFEILNGTGLKSYSILWLLTLASAIDIYFDRTPRLQTAPRGQDGIHLLIMKHQRIPHPERIEIIECR